MKRALMAVAAAMLAAAAGAQDRVAVMLRTNDWALVGHGTNLTAATIGAASAAQGAKADGALASTNAVGRVEWTGSSLDITTFGPGTGASGDLQWIPQGGLYEYDVSNYEWRKMAREGVSLWPWTSITNAPTIPSVGSLSPREGWRVWTDNTNVFAVHGNGSGAITNASFSWIMNHISSNNTGWASVVNLGEMAQPNTPAAFVIDAPISLNAGITIRGQGNYGTEIRAANGYAGQMFLCGDRSTVGGIIGFDRIRFQNRGAPTTNAVLDFTKCAEAKVYDCEFTSWRGPAIVINSSTNGSQWNTIHRSWFVGLSNSLPMIDIIATNAATSVLDTKIADCLFWVESNAAVRVRGAPQSVSVNDGQFYCWNAVCTGLVFNGGNGITVHGNTFNNWPAAAIPIAFTADTSNDFRAVVSGNAFATNCFSTSSVSVSAQSHGIMAAGNRGATIGLQGANVGGMGEFGTAAASNATAFLGVVGGTASGAIYSAASSALTGPAADELPTAGWVRTLLSSGKVIYNTTNALTVGWDSVAVAYTSAAPASTAYRVHTIASNNQYVGSAVYTTAVSSVRGPVIVSAYLARSGGTGGPTLTIEPEIYFVTNLADTATIRGDFSAAPQAIGTTTQLYQWVISFPDQEFTQPLYLVRRFKVASVTGASLPSLVVAVGGQYPSSLQYQSPSESSVAYATTAGTATNAVAAFVGAVNSTTTTLTSNGVLYAYGAPSVGTNRTIAGIWLQLATTTNTAALGGFTDVTNFTLEVYGSYSVGGVLSGSTVSLPVPLGGAWMAQGTFPGYWLYTVEIPTNVAITSAVNDGRMPTYPRFGLRYRGAVSSTSVCFVVSSKWLP